MPAIATTAFQDQAPPQAEKLVEQFSARGVRVGPLEPTNRPLGVLGEAFLARFYGYSDALLHFIALTFKIWCLREVRLTKFGNFAEPKSLLLLRQE